MTIRRWYEHHAYEIKTSIFSLGLGGVFFGFLWVGMAIALLYQ